VVELKPSQPKAKRAIGQKPASKRKASSRRFSFPLFDQRKPPAAICLEDEPGSGPCPSVFVSNSSAAASPMSPFKGRVDGSRLCLRLQALKRALEDLPGQARRLARLRARRSKVPHLRLLSPLRPGPAPGQRRRPRYEVDYVLAECHGLAWDALKPDTS
jgi:hypothetical protein